MTGGMTTDELLAEQHLTCAPNQATQALAHTYANNITSRLPGMPRNDVGELLLHVADDIVGFVQHFVGEGMTPDKAFGVVTKMFAVAGAELYTESLSAEDLAERVAAAARSAL